MQNSTNPWPYPAICAHRGGGTLAPENTLAGMRYGADHGFKGVEFDVMLSRDQVPVIVHDPRLGRTVAGVGNIPDFTAAQLQAMDAGRWHSPAYAGEPIPLLDQVLQFCKQRHLWMNVEIKPAPGQDEATARITAAHVAQAFAAEQSDSARRTLLPLLSSFSFSAMQVAQVTAPWLPRGMLYEEIPDDWPAQLQQLGCVSLHCNHTRLTAAMTRMIRAAGYGVFVYTVNDPARARELLGWGVNGMVTDRLDLIAPDFA